MMKTLIFDGQELQAEKIVKTETDIIGYDAQGNEVFAFRGILDFTLFTLKDEGGVVIGFSPQLPTQGERLIAIEDALLMIL